MCMCAFMCLVCVCVSKGLCIICICECAYACCVRVCLHTCVYVPIHSSAQAGDMCLAKFKWASCSVSSVHLRINRPMHDMHMRVCRCMCMCECDCILAGMRPPTHVAQAGDMCLAKFKWASCSVLTCGLHPSKRPAYISVVIIPHATQFLSRCACLYELFCVSALVHVRGHVHWYGCLCVDADASMCVCVGMCHVRGHVHWYGCLSLDAEVSMCVCAGMCLCGCMCACV